MRQAPNHFSVVPNVGPVPACAGVGLKPQHFSHILENLPAIGWFEIHPENYLMPGGPMLHYLGRIREHYPLSFHSVGMSLGSAEGVDENHIGKLKVLSDRFEPALVSDHLSWSRWRQTALNDLLPMPYTEGALRIMADNIDRVQEILGRVIAIENPSSYFDLAGADMPEWEFLVQLAQRTGATILLDINNIYVSACNHGWDAAAYIEHIPAGLVTEIHLAGHTIQHTDFGEVRIDDHGARVCDEVCDLYRFAVAHLGRFPTLIEWDTEVPEFTVLEAEAELADAVLAGSASRQKGRHHHAGH